MFTRDAFEFSGDLRLVAVDGEKSWVEGGFGKLRSGAMATFALSRTSAMAASCGNRGSPDSSARPPSAGRTQMGFPDEVRRWVDKVFRSAFALVSRPFDRVILAGGVDVFETRKRGSDVGEEYDERGWFATVAAKRDWAHFTGVIELLQVWSDRDRERVVLRRRQDQTQLQGELRICW